MEYLGPAGESIISDGGVVAVVARVEAVVGHLLAQSGLAHLVGQGVEYLGPAGESIISDGGVVAVVARVEAVVGHLLAQSGLAHLVGQGVEYLQQHPLAQVVDVRKTGHLANTTVTAATVIVHVDSDINLSMGTAGFTPPSLIQTVG